MENTENEGHEAAESFSAKRHLSDQGDWSDNRTSNQRKYDLKEQQVDPMDVDNNHEEGEPDSKL